MQHPLFVFASDLHLQPGAWAKRPEIHGDSYHSFDQIIRYCLDHELPLVLGGDTWDQRNPDSRSLRVFFNGASQMRLAGLPIYFVQGDHDFRHDVPWPMVVHDAAVPLNDSTEAFGDWRVRGIDWTPAGPPLAARMAELPGDVDIVVMHESWLELQRIGAIEGSIAELFSGRNFWLLTGDYHRHVQQQVPTNDGHVVNVLSPGSTCMQANDESPDKAFYVIGQDDREHLAYESVPLVTRPMLRVRLDQPDVDWEQLVRQLIGTFEAAEARAGQLRLPPEEFRPLVKVSYLTTQPEYRDRLEAMYGSAVHFFWDPKQVVDNVVIDYAAMSQAGAFDSLVGAIQGMEKDQAVVDGLTRLLRTVGPLAAELDAMRTEAIQATTP